MAITVYEHFESRQTGAGAHPHQERKYVVLGVEDDEYSARITVQAGSPVVVDLYNDTTVLVWRQQIEMVRAGHLMWYGFVHYSTVRPTNESVFSFDTTGGAAHITQSLQTMANHHNPAILAAAPDYKGAIGVTNDGVQGVDVPIPVYRFSERHYLPPTFVTPAYKLLIYRLTGKINSSPFKGFDPGEVMFFGALGSLRAGGDWEIDYSFAASENKANLTVGPITVTAKLGQDYLWVRYRVVEDTTAKTLVHVPESAHVERVAEYMDLNDLGI